jgi:D-alanyl-D-alanine carboxypeptidase/D-alanyl-D-alanine-endopeptidase (penicillin-binding protein 4)
VLLPILIAAILPFRAAAPQSPQYASVRTSAEAPKRGTSGKKKTKTVSRRPAGGPAGGPAIHYTMPVGPAALATDLGAMLDRTMHGGKWGVMVVSISRGETLFTRNADVQLMPASTMKLFTSSLAFDRFGPAGRFQTQVLRVGAIGTDGVLRGDLVLKGDGDPTLAGKATDGSGEPPMESLARQIAAAGITHVSGSIVGDASAFDDSHVPEGWKRRYLGASYAARVSALSFNENKIRVIVRTDRGHAAISFDPAVTGVPLQNNVQVTGGSRGGRIGIRQDTAGKFLVSGWIGSLSGPRDYTVVVENPELFASGALRAALVSHGVAVDGQVRVGTAPATAVHLASVQSPSLDLIITQMNGESNNHFAELLFRDAAHSTGTAGSAENGNVLLRRFLFERANIAPTSVFAADGSGLSTLDRVTPRAMVQLLGYARLATWGTVFEQSLPVAGESETLRHRMRGTPAQGNLHAKTGTTNDVASLGGYVTGRSGEQLAFSFIYNGADRWHAKKAMDAMGATLASFSR